MNYYLSYCCIFKCSHLFNISQNTEWLNLLAVQAKLEKKNCGRRCIKKLNDFKIFSKFTIYNFLLLLLLFSC